jgi:membrane-associated phospholipid phosphatase
MAGEAMVDSLAVNYVFKIASRRERPTVDNGRGLFFQPGVDFDSSFASNHSVVAWSSATVIAARSDRPLLKIAVYGVATGVSATRVIGRDHFPSDVYVGSFVGWMIGRYVVHHHIKGLE